MKRVNFPNNTNDLVEVISPSVRHARYSSKRDFSKTWYQPEEYQSIRMECQMLAEESKESKISKLLDGTTPYHRRIQNQRETQDTLKKKDKEFTRAVARLKIWAVYNRTGRGLEKYIRPETHGLIRQGQIVAHRNAVLYHQDRLMDFCQHLPDFVAQELATTSVHFSASSSQLAKNMGTADAFATVTEPNPRHRFIIEKQRSATGHYFEDGRQENEDRQERKSFLTTTTTTTDAGQSTCEEKASVPLVTKRFEEKNSKGRNRRSVSPCRDQGNDITTTSRINRDALQQTKTKEHSSPLSTRRTRRKAGGVNHHRPRHDYSPETLSNAAA